MILETYTRVFVDQHLLDQTSAFYCKLLDGKEKLRFDDPKTGLTLVAVSSPKLSILIISGPPDRRQPFEDTKLTIKVSELSPFLEHLLDGGAEQLEPIQATPVGHKTRFRHPDGLIVEYVDHTKS